MKLYTSNLYSLMVEISVLVQIFIMSIIKIKYWYKTHKHKMFIYSIHIKVMVWDHRWTSCKRNCIFKECMLEGSVHIRESFGRFGVLTCPDWSKNMYTGQLKFRDKSLKNYCPLKKILTVKHLCNSPREWSLIWENWNLMSVFHFNNKKCVLYSHNK